MAWMVLLGALSVIAVAINLFSRLARLRARVKSQLLAVDALLRRRYELIESLAGPSREETVLRAKTRAVQARDRVWKDLWEASLMREWALAEESLTQALVPLLSGGPGSGLKELQSSETGIAKASQAFNNSVRIYNAAVGAFPTSAIARGMRCDFASPLDSKS